MTSSQKHFTQAETLWDLERLYKDLATVKGNTLTKMEKIHLCGLLCGYSPHEIAEQLHKSVRGVEAFMCKTLYQYIKHLSNHDEERMKNHRDITQWLAELGYKLPGMIDSSSNSQTQPLSGLIRILNSSVHILNSSVHIEKIDTIKNKMVVLNILRVEIPCPLDSSKDNDPTNGSNPDSSEEEKSG